MTILKQFQRAAIALVLGVILLTTGACSIATQTSRNPALPPATGYEQLERGDTVSVAARMIEILRD